MSSLSLQPSSDQPLTYPADIQAGATPAISNFRQLQELQLVVISPSSTYTALLSSITSIELRKIIIFTRSGDLSTEVGEWDPIDEQLCGVVDRLHSMGYNHTLEVELHPMVIGNDTGEYSFAGFLPKFREKGVVTSRT